ncbi:neuroendocrine convertase 1-like isoform X2 [Mytilus trossulus]|uniref:neuroendocrine convertase 1-like isoform X2 n=1 Tax=Mytilus trossulus TaxID=6551 RepID=UPI00300793C8
MKCTQFFGVILIWFSKFLWFTECATCSIRIDDPELNALWYLKNNRPDGYDMNVLPAWENCVNGSEVTVGVVDKGVQDHRDLNINRNLDAGKIQSEAYWAGQLEVEQDRHNQQRWRSGYNRQPQRRWRYGYNGQPQQRWNSAHNIIQRRKQESLKHGTRVAGIVAAKQNGHGIVGIAFGAEIADITIASSAVFESFNAALLIHRRDVIDVYSCSFANFHTGTKTYPLLPNQQHALEYGTTHGRRGRGSVYVFATGNSGGEETDVFRDSCSYDRLVTNRYVISVAGIQHNLQKLPNGEACSAMMVAAFTAKAGENLYKVKTTDIGGRTTLNFNQNSAAAPMVSGAVALALSANSALTYRDIMHLLVQTSRSDFQDQTYQSKFFTNAANIKVSSYFGFGLLDIGKLVDRSKTWSNVPPRETCITRKTFDSSLNRDPTHFVVDITECAVDYIEHVEISLKVNHIHAGQIQWVLVSPYGTKSTILPGRGLDPTTNMNITVLTVQLWGENPEGQWRFEPTAMFNKSLDHGTVETVSLSIHGYTCLSRHECLPSADQDPVPQIRRPLQEPENLQECPTTLDSRCVEQCSNNTDCNGRKICCNNGCGHTCEWSLTDQSRRNSGSSVLTERSRECPTTLESRCVEQCSNNTDCNGRKICCNNGCGHTCEWPLTGYWRHWSAWSRCSQTCGDGSRTRKRVCSRQGRCRGKSQEIQQCNSPACGYWRHWSAWSRCSQTCGDERRTRTRVCSRQGRCRGKSQETQQCNSPACGYWRHWSAWSRCSQTCGDERRTRTRVCSRQGRCRGKSQETQQCNSPACGYWRHWSRWSRCSQTCGDGNRTRTRVCSRHGRCTGERQETQKCNLPACDIGYWRNWSAWSQCTQTCGDESRTRTRDCSRHGRCYGDGQEAQFCNLPACQTGSGIFGEWSQWSRCSSTSGYGTRDRRRRCAGTCLGNRRELENCFTPYLPHSCWDTYHSCSQYVIIHGCHTTDYVINKQCRKTCGLC